MYELSCSRGNLFFHDVLCVFLLLSLVLSALELTVPEVFGFVTGAALVLSVLMKSNLVRGDLHAFLLNLVSLLEIPFLLLGLFMVKKDSDQLQVLVTVSYER